MYYQPFDRSMGLWIINEFLKLYIFFHFLIFEMAHENMLLFQAY